MNHSSQPVEGGQGGAYTLYEADRAQLARVSANTLVQSRDYAAVAEGSSKLESAMNEEEIDQAQANG